MDPLSRYPLLGETGDVENDTIFEIETIDMRNEQMKDRWMKSVKEQIENNDTKTKQLFLI